MYRIIPFIIFFAAITYLFYSPTPMDKIGKTVKSRDCYHLKLMDQERLSISSENVNPTASKETVQELKNITSIDLQSPPNRRLAMSQKNK